MHISWFSDILINSLLKWLYEFTFPSSKQFMTISVAWNPLHYFQNFSVMVVKLNLIFCNWIWNSLTCDFNKKQTPESKAHKLSWLAVGYLCDSCRMGEDVMAPQGDVWNLLQWDIRCFCSSKSGVVLNMIKSWVTEGRPNGIVLALSPQDEKKARLVH